MLTWAKFDALCEKLAISINNGRSVNGALKNLAGVYGIPTGGCFVAREMARILHLPVLDNPSSKPDHRILIVDDIVDSGATMTRFINKYPNAVYFSLFISKTFNDRWHKSSIDLPHHVIMGWAEIAEGWITFPWENAEVSGPEDSVIRLLESIGEDPKRDGLRETPARVVRSLREMTVGYQQSAKEILSKVFDESHDEVVILKDIPFTSLCEHHLLPFTGTVDIGYIPGKLVGLSKLARLVDCFSQRLQLQERLTRQIAEAIDQHLEAKGTAVVVKARHGCMSCRGVRKPGSEMVTSAMLKVFRDNPTARAEFLHLCKE